MSNISTPCGPCCELDPFKAMCCAPAGDAGCEKTVSYLRSIYTLSTCAASTRCPGTIAIWNQRLFNNPHRRRLRREGGQPLAQRLCDFCNLPQNSTEILG